jgi:hypothetical protein
VILTADSADVFAWDGHAARLCGQGARLLSTCDNERQRVVGICGHRTDVRSYVFLKARPNFRTALCMSDGRTEVLFGLDAKLGLR